MVHGQAKQNKANAGDSLRIVAIAKNWLHQGVSYMDSGERAFRLFLEIAEFLLLWIILNYFSPLNNIFNALLSSLIVHSINWVFNSNFCALMLFSYAKMKNRGQARTVKYVNDLTQRVQKSGSICGVFIFGSISRGVWHRRSDIDMRFVRRPGILNLILAASLTMRERFLAFVWWQPLDLYLADDTGFFKKMRRDEVPIALAISDPGILKDYSVVRVVDHLEALAEQPH